MLSGSLFYHCRLLNFFFFHLHDFSFTAEIFFPAGAVPVSLGGLRIDTGAHFYVVKKHNNFPFVIRWGCKMLVKNVAV